MILTRLEAATLAAVAILIGIQLFTDLLIVHVVLVASWLVSSRLEPRGKVSS